MFHVSRSFLRLQSLTLRGMTDASQSSSSSNFSHISCVSCPSRHELSSNPLLSTTTLPAKPSPQSSHAVGDYILQGLGEQPRNSMIDAASKYSSKSTSLFEYDQSFTSFNSNHTKNSVASSPTDVGLNSVRSCATALQSYCAAYYAWADSSPYGESWESIPSYTSTTTIYQYVTTTLCDGIPRAISPHDPVVSSSVVDPGGQAVELTYSVTPPCTVAPEDSSSFLAIMSSETDSYNSATMSFFSALSSWTSEKCIKSSETWSCPADLTDGMPTSPLYPVAACVTPCSSCQITAQAVRLLYWPQSALPSNGICLSGDEANMTMFTAKSTGTGPNTVLFDSTYLTSPTAYLSYSGVGVSWCGNQSIIRTNTIIPVDPGDVSSLRSVITPVGGGNAPGAETMKYINYAGPFPFNYADLNTPMPYSAYAYMWFCLGEPSLLCATMTPDLFSPILAYPSSFIQLLDPTLSTCMLVNGYEGVYDPPHALQPWPSAAEPVPNSPILSKTPKVSKTSPITSPAAVPSAVPPTPFQTTYKPLVSSLAESSMIIPPIASQHGHGDGASGNPHPNDPTSQTNQHPQSSQPVQMPFAGDSSDKNPDPKSSTDPGSGPNPKAEPDSTGNDGLEETPPNNIPDTTGPTQSSEGHGGDQPHDASSNIVSILHGSEDKYPHSSKTDPGSGHDPHNDVIANRPASQSTNGGYTAVAYGGIDTQNSDPKPDFISDDSATQSLKMIAEIGAQPIYALANDPKNVKVAGLTLHSGEKTTIAGTSVAVHSGYIVIGQGAYASTVSISKSAVDPVTGAGSDGQVDREGNGALNPAALPTEGLGAILTFGSSSYTALEDSARDGTVFIGSQALSVGGNAITMDGYVVSYGSRGLVIDSSSTIALTTPLAADPAAGMEATATISFNLGTQRATAFEENNGNVVIGTQTLSVGGPAIKIDGHVVTFGDSGLLVDSSSMIPLESLVTVVPEMAIKTTAAAIADEKMASLVSGLLNDHGSLTEVLSPLITSASPKPLDEPVGTASSPESAGTTGTTSGATPNGIRIPRLTIVGSICLVLTLL